MSTNLYVAYYIANRIDRSNGNVRSLFPASDSDRIAEELKREVNAYVDSQHGQLVDTFVETPEKPKTDQWPKLRLAIEACKKQNATLLIAELGTLTGNGAFSIYLLNANVNFHCVDQPFITRDILEALHKHAQVQKKRHGDLIRAGLKKTTAKSGNPNAAMVIGEVNKPKIDVAIVFADLLQPITADYKRKGFSQRQMVKALNDEGFTAPEGGSWVLSQLQKVLDRVKLNEVARELKSTATELQSNGSNHAEIAEQLNAKGVSSLKRPGWDEAQVKKLCGRIEQVQDIENINKFVLKLLPIMHKMKTQSNAPVEIITQLEAAKLPVKFEHNTSESIA